MPSGFPNSIDSFSTTHVDNVNEAVRALTDNDHSDAINHIETELGILPRGTYTNVVTRLNAFEFIAFKSLNVTAYTLVAADASTCVTLTNAAASVLTVPANATVAFAIGTMIAIRQGSAAGQITIQGASGVTLVEVNNSFITQAPGAWVWLIKTNTNAWDLVGATA